MGTRPFHVIVALVVVVCVFAGLSGTAAWFALLPAPFGAVETAYDTGAADASENPVHPQGAALLTLSPRAPPA